jgi:hypothetical protein
MSFVTSQKVTTDIIPVFRRVCSGCRRKRRSNCAARLDQTGSRVSWSMATSRGCITLVTIAITGRSWMERLTTDLCQQCHVEPATENWAGQNDSVSIARNPQLIQRWCKKCVLKAQIAHLKTLPCVAELERQLSILEATATATAGDDSRVCGATTKDEQYTCQKPLHHDGPHYNSDLAIAEVARIIARKNQQNQT